MVSSSSHEQMQHVCSCLFMFVYKTVLITTEDLFLPLSWTNLTCLFKLGFERQWKSQTLHLNGFFLLVNMQHIWHLFNNNCIKQITNWTFIWFLPFMNQYNNAFQFRFWNAAIRGHKLPIGIVFSYHEQMQHVYWSDLFDINCSYKF